MQLTMKKPSSILKNSILCLCLAGCFSTNSSAENPSVQVGPRPYFLISQMKPSLLKSELEACANRPLQKSNFSIGHRGAPLMFPEHTLESYQAAARMGAGVIECDITFTKDKELVCRHAQNDLHTTTNILLTPFASKCSVPFKPFDPKSQSPAQAECRCDQVPRSWCFPRPLELILSIAVCACCLCAACVLPLELITFVSMSTFVEAR